MKIKIPAEEILYNPDCREEGGGEKMGLNPEKTGEMALIADQAMEDKVIPKLSDYTRRTFTPRNAGGSPPKSSYAASGSSIFGGTNLNLGNNKQGAGISRILSPHHFRSVMSICQTGIKQI